MAARSTGCAFVQRQGKVDQKSYQKKKDGTALPCLSLQAAARMESDTVQSLYLPWTIPTASLVLFMVGKLMRLRHCLAQ